MPTFDPYAAARAGGNPLEPDLTLDGAAYDQARAKLEAAERDKEREKERKRRNRAIRDRREKMGNDGPRGTSPGAAAMESAGQAASSAGQAASSAGQAVSQAAGAAVSGGKDAAQRAVDYATGAFLEVGNSDSLPWIIGGTVFLVGATAAIALTRAK